MKLYNRIKQEKMIIQAAKITGTGLARSGLRGVGVGIGFKCASNKANNDSKIEAQKNLLRLF